MFTGITTDIGTITSVNAKTNSKSFVIATSYDEGSIEIGCSICCSGVCLTVVEKGTEEDKTWFSVDVSKETIDRTTLGSWSEGTNINLERALKVGEELGGHIATGHVDGTAEVSSIEAIDDNNKVVLKANDELIKYIIEKGTVILDGVALTINGTENNSFWVNLIPHTLKSTTFNNIKSGDKLNLEIDLFARYTEKFLNK